MRRNYTALQLLRLTQRSYAQGWEDSVRRYEEVYPKSGATRRRRFQAKKAILTLLLLFTVKLIIAQELTQTIQGKVIDQQLQADIRGASIIVQVSAPC